MKPQGSKQKGSSFERLIAKKFGAAWQIDVTREHRPSRGDLRFPTDLMICVECKTGRAYDPLAWVTLGHNSGVGKAWTQVTHDAEGGRMIPPRSPLVVMRQHSRQTWVAWHSDATTYSVRAGLNNDARHWMDRPDMEIRYRQGGVVELMTFMLFDRFLATAKLEDFLPVA